MKIASTFQLASGAALLYSLVEPWRPIVRHFEIALENLPASADGTRVAQMSDLHVGFLTPLPLARKIIRLCAAQNADLIALTGDLVTRRGSYFPPLNFFARPVTDYALGLAELLADLRAPLGVWAVAGNHDSWDGKIAPVAEIMAQANVRFLMNESTKLAYDLNLVGLDDLRAGSPDVRRALKDVPAREGHLILNHNPRLAALLRERNALILSGHTHGGQVKLPFGIRKSPCDARQTFWQHGLYRVGRAQLYVSSGAGHVGVPVRLGVPPEIVVWTLRRA